MEPGSENPGYLDTFRKQLSNQQASMEPGSENPGYMGNGVNDSACITLQWSRGPKTPDTE